MMDQVRFSELENFSGNETPIVQTIASETIKEQSLLLEKESSYFIFNLEPHCRFSLYLKTSLKKIKVRYEFLIGEESELELILDESENFSGECSFYFELQKNATVRVLGGNTGLGKTRKNILSKLTGENALFEYRALHLNSGEANHQTHLKIIHEVPHCISRQSVRNVLNESAFVFYDGIVEVEKLCTGTKSSQLINTLLLSENAKVSVKPVLKIYHDDVECSHGNTCGELDPESLFYLESRGLSPKESKRLLTESFIREVIKEHPDSSLSRLLLQKILP